MADERYEKITANITDGDLVWRYKVAGLCHASMAHDEDVSEYTDEEIIDLTCSMLSVDVVQRELIEVVWW
jgi:hypothetical protein